MLLVDGRHAVTVSRTILLDENALGDVAMRAPRQGVYEIELRFTPTGSKRFSEITRTLTGRRLAIVFDGRVLIVPHISMSIAGGTANIQGRFTETEAATLTNSLREAMISAALNVTVNIGGTVPATKTVHLRPGSTLLDALGAVGGWKENANLSKVSILHRDSASGHTTTTYHNVRAILNGDAENPGLVAGDSILVPERLF